MNCYFDGSVGGISDEWLTLGGFIATDKTWAAFHNQWEALLRNRYPIAPYIHMTDLITGNDPFERKAGWTDCKVDALVSDVVTLLGQTSATGEMCAFACAVDVQARGRLVKEGYEVSDPAVICAEVGIGNLLNWYTDRYGLELACLFFDQNEPFIKSIRSRWLKAMRPNRMVTDELFWGRIEDVEPVSMQDTPGIQAADIVAWAFTRRLRNSAGDRWASLADTLLGNRTSRGILTNTQLDPITEEIMRPRYPRSRQADK